MNFEIPNEVAPKHVKKYTFLVNGQSAASEPEWNYNKLNLDTSPVPSKAFSTFRYREYACPLYPQGSCPWYGPRYKLAQHFQSKHEELALDYPLFVLDLTKERVIHWTLRYMGELFVVATRVYPMKNELHVAVHHVPMHQLAGHFEFTLRAGNIAYTSTQMLEDTCYDRTPHQHVVALIDHLYRVVHPQSSEIVFTLLILWHTSELAGNGHGHHGRNNNIEIYEQHLEKLFGKVYSFIQEKHLDEKMRKTVSDLLAKIHVSKIPVTKSAKKGLTEYYLERVRRYTCSLDNCVFTSNLQLLLQHIQRVHAESLHEDYRLAVQQRWTSTWWFMTSRNEIFKSGCTYWYDGSVWFYAKHFGSSLETSKYQVEVHLFKTKPKSKRRRDPAPFSKLDLIRRGPCNTFGNGPDDSSSLSIVFMTNEILSHDIDFKEFPYSIKILYLC